MSIYELVIEVLERINEIKEDETNIKIAGGKGYSAGKAYPNKTFGVNKLLGNEENEEQKEYVLKPVQISKAFKRRKSVK